MAALTSPTTPTPAMAATPTSPPTPTAKPSAAYVLQAKTERIAVAEREREKKKIPCELRERLVTTVRYLVKSKILISIEKKNIKINRVKFSINTDC